MVCNVEATLFGSTRLAKVYHSLAEEDSGSLNVTGLGTPTGTVMRCSESRVWLLGCSEVVEISIYFATGLENNLNITN